MAVLFVSALPLAVVVPIPTLPFGSIETLTLFTVKNSKVSSSEPAEVSALIKVSWSTSLIPPSDPQLLPVPYPSKLEVVVLYLI